MSEPDVAYVEQRLAAVIRAERREAIGYTLLTVLCTPVFVLAAGLVALLILGFMLHLADYEIEIIDAKWLYTGVILFLAHVLIFVLRGSEPPEEPQMFDRTWLAAAIVFFVPLVLTYGTNLPERVPVAFAIVFSVLGFTVLALLGRVQMDQPIPDDSDGEEMFKSFLLALSAFVAMSYGEATRSSWLWVPPKTDEIRIAAWILCKLATEITTPLEARPVPRRILNMLSRLKLVAVTDRKLRITLKGQDLVATDCEIEYVTRE